MAMTMWATDLKRPGLLAVAVEVGGAAPGVVPASAASKASVISSFLFRGARACVLVQRLQGMQRLARGRSTS